MPNKKEPRAEPLRRMDRAMDLAWAESLTAPTTPPAAVPDDIVDVLPDFDIGDANIAPEEILEVLPVMVPADADVIPIDTAVPDDGGPFIEAVLVQSTSDGGPGPFIEAVVVETAPADDATPVSVADWLVDLAPPKPDVPPLAGAMPDWLSQLADTETTARPTPQPTAGPKPDWLDDLG